MAGLYNWILSNNIQQPIKLEIGLDKVVFDRNGTGNDARYFTVFINGLNVTQMVAEVIDKPISKARDTKGSVILHGSGMDMAFYLQTKVYRAAYQAGYPNMFDMNLYNYIGKKKGANYRI